MPKRARRPGPGLGSKAVTYSRAWSALCDRRPDWGVALDLLAAVCAARRIDVDLAKDAYADACAGLPHDAAAAEAGHASVIAALAWMDAVPP